MEDFERLERMFGEWIGNPNCVAVSSGTAALHLALESLGLPYGSQVIVPEFTMVACARACTMAGLQPTFIDCGADLNLNPSLLNRTLTRYTRAIMPVHVYGRRCDMEAVINTGLTVVEDMSEIHGVNPHPQSDAACWSFYKNKILAGEEGGMIAFKNPDYAEKAKVLRCQGFTEDHDFIHVPRGVNARMSNLHAAVIGRSLENYPSNAEDRRQIESWYNEVIPSKWHMPARDAVWVYDLRIRGMTHWQQRVVISSLNEQGHPARHSFRPMSEQPEYRFSHSAYKRLEAYRASAEVLYLPVRPGMTEADVQAIAGALVTAVEQTVDHPLAGTGRSAGSEGGNGLITAPPTHPAA